MLLAKVVTNNMVYMFLAITKKKGTRWKKHVFQFLKHKRNPRKNINVFLNSQATATASGPLAIVTHKFVRPMVC